MQLNDEQQVWQPSCTVVHNVVSLFPWFFSSTDPRPRVIHTIQLKQDSPMTSQLPNLMAEFLFLFLLDCCIILHCDHCNFPWSKDHIFSWISSYPSDNCVTVSLTVFWPFCNINVTPQGSILALFIIYTTLVMTSMTPKEAQVSHLYSLLILPIIISL